ncbi:MAG: OPT/YSL family transporter [Myxococcales bacterium]|nr:OPT/YSL family transporter [Myxococcales bacterium]
MRLADRDNHRLDPEQVARLGEAEWYTQAYRGDEPQLTLRAVVTGLLLGAVLSFANVYIGLKTGWFFGMALAAGLGSFAIWRVLATLRLARTPLSLLETSCMQSTASSAAYATGNMVVGVIPAMLLLSVSPGHPLGTQLHWAALAAWIACIAALGVTLAIPLKRQLINRERLAFPSGTAAAIMLHGLHHDDARNAARSPGRIVAAAISIGAALPIVRDLRAIALIGPSSRVFDWLPRFSIGGTSYAPSDAGLVLDHSLLVVAAGVFAGLRTTAWMFAGGLITAFVLGPIALDWMWSAPGGALVGATRGLGTTWLDAGIWLGAPLLVAYALVAVVSRWRVFGRLVSHAQPADPALERTDVEIPVAWFWIGFVTCGGAAIVLARILFDIPVILGALAVALSLVFSAVACRITGETDITPGGPMGKLTQLVFGVLRPHHPSTNLMTASMTHASSVASADLLLDLQTGYLLGANPRRQFAAQALGILAGTGASVLAYFILIPDATALAIGDDGVARFAAPASCSSSGSITCTRCIVSW